MSDYEWVFFPAAVLAVLLFRIALAPFWMQREVKQNLTTPNTEDLRALVAKWRAIAEEDKPAKYKVDRPLNEVDGATGYLWLGLQYERGVYEAKLELAYELEALLDAGDPAVAADDVPTVTIMEDVGDPEWFTQPSQCAVKVDSAGISVAQQAVCDVAVLPCISDDKPHCLSHIAFKTGLPDEWGDTDWRYGKFPASPEAAQ